MKEKREPNKNYLFPLWKNCNNQSLDHHNDEFIAIVSVNKCTQSRNVTYFLINL